MINLNDVLLAMSNIPVDDPIAEIWGRQMQGGYKIIEYTGSLPITINANGDVLIDYRIYGADGGVGEQMENLLDRKNSVAGKFLDESGGTRTQSNFAYTDFLIVNASAPYTIKNYDGTLGGTAAICFYDVNFDFLYGITYLNRWSVNFTTEANVAYVRCSYKPADRVSLTLGSTAPASYIPYGYKLPIAITDKNLLADDISQFGNGYVNTNGSINPPDETKKEKYSDYVSIVPNTNYIFAMANVFPGNPSGDIDGKPWRTIAFYDQNKAFISISRRPELVNEALQPSPVTVTSPNDAFFTRVTWRSYGSEECPVLVTNRNVYPVYIGENQLDEGEYVSYSDRKIYRMVDGTLTPTDPPVPFPEIPTIDGETVIDYDGTPKPSQVYVKYKGKE